MSAKYNKEAKAYYRTHLVDGVSPDAVVNVDGKINRTIERISDINRWQCPHGWGHIKKRCLEKLKKHLDFLMRVEVVKEDYEWRRVDDPTQWELTVDAIA